MNLLDEERESESYVLSSCEREGTKVCVFSVFCDRSASQLGDIDMSCGCTEFCGYHGWIWIVFFKRYVLCGLSVSREGGRRFTQSFILWI